MILNFKKKVEKIYIQGSQFEEEEEDLYSLKVYKKKMEKIIVARKSI